MYNAVNNPWVWSRQAVNADRDQQELPMPSDTELLKQLYDRFNARDMEALLATMHGDVMWANGMEGGHVYRRRRSELLDPAMGDD